MENSQIIRDDTKSMCGPEIIISGVDLISKLLFSEALNVQFDYSNRSSFINRKLTQQT